MSEDDRIDLAVGPAPSPVLEVDCVIVGGGPAGLSAAVNLGDSRTWPPTASPPTTGP